VPLLLPRVGYGVPPVLLLHGVPEDHVVDQRQDGRLNWLEGEGREQRLENFQGPLPGLELDR